MDQDFEIVGNLLSFISFLDLLTWFSSQLLMN